LKAVLLNGRFTTSIFEIGFERFISQFSQNKDVDGTRSTKIHELKQFKFGTVFVVIIQTTTEQLSKLKKICMEQTAKIRTLEAFKYYISVQVSTFRLF